ncbi:MAG: histidine kinase [Paludisphaera borealis]|uniref:sensor histidine kinase n=1 Tax=Paludisphaera borealis TaxID=1387353 RepID=UPI002849B6C7|nr:ATP-binding protein [Paludisphaera borealis]MDR3622342.1 histidine kinase [Paludisphaera borealis]
MLAALLVLVSSSVATAGEIKRVLVVYPTSDGQPGILRFQESLRLGLMNGPTARFEIFNEYLDSARFPDERYQNHLADFLRTKYLGREPDVIITALAPSLDFVLKYRDNLFPGIPVVFGALDKHEAEARNLGKGVLGVPMTVDLEPTLDLALRLHPDARRAVVVSGKSRTDAYWTEEARRAFHRYETKLDFIYLTGLPLNDLLREVANLPDRTFVYYLHVFEDGLGNAYIPADVVRRVSAAANAPVYGHYSTYLGGGIVGGCFVRFETEGANAADIALRVLAGQEPEKIRLSETTKNPTVVDWSQMNRWGIGEERLPRDIIILNRPPSFWDLYKWQVIGATSVCVAEGLLMAVLLLERANRRRAKKGLLEGQLELRRLTGRLLLAQETERRRIALELHDDLNQRLALLAVDLDLLGQNPPTSGALLGERMHELSGRVKQLSSEVHELSHQLHPTKVEQLGLVVAVRGLCGELSHSHDLNIDFTAEQVASTISADTALCLYRITQEALRNVIRHSGARHARVELRGSPNAISLLISDDGCGFDTESADGKGGLGLVSMRERLRLVGGDITILSRTPGGVQIDVRIPIDTSTINRREDASHGQPTGVS